MTPSHTDIQAVLTIDHLAFADPVGMLHQTFQRTQDHMGAIWKGIRHVHQVKGRFTVHTGLLGLGYARVALIDPWMEYPDAITDIHTI